MKGRVVFWKSESAFGFVRPDDGTEDVFLHARDLGRGGIFDIEVGHSLTFDAIERGSGKKLVASNIERLGHVGTQRVPEGRELMDSVFGNRH